MFQKLALVLFSLIGFVAPAAAERLVVVELYTSQGCSSCPPADEILYDLHATHQDILALSFHVNYWDYLGWKDDFAKEEFTARQAAYNEKLKSKYRLVTPQMIFDGRAHVAGGHTIKIFKAFAEAQKGKDLADLSVQNFEKDGVSAAKVMIAPSAGAQAADVYLVRYASHEAVKIDRGENRGRTLDYLNTVTEWSKIGEWNGTSTGSFDVMLEGDAKAAVIVQVAGSGPVLAARKIGR